MKFGLNLFPRTTVCIQSFPVMSLALFLMSPFLILTGNLESLPHTFLASNSTESEGIERWNAVEQNFL